MEARKLAAQMAAICPFALVLGMGYSARRPAPAHQTLKYSDAQNARLEAYRLMAANAPAVGAGDLTIRRHADLWLRINSAEKLQALTPAFEEDSTEDNARAEVIAEWRWLIQRLNYAMRREIVAHRYTLATEDGTRIIRLSEILKHSDFLTFHFASSVTTHAIRVIGLVLENVPAADVQRFHAAVGSVNTDHGRLIAMYKILKSNYEDYVLRRAGSGLDIMADPLESAKSTDDFDDPFYRLNSRGGDLQHEYVSAIKDEVQFRRSAREILGFVLSPARS